MISPTTMLSNAISSLSFDERCIRLLNNSSSGVGGGHQGSSSLQRIDHGRSHSDGVFSPPSHYLTHHMFNSNSIGNLIHPVNVNDVSPPSSSSMIFHHYTTTTNSSTSAGTLSPSSSSSGAAAFTASLPPMYILEQQHQQQQHPQHPQHPQQQQQQQQRIDGSLHHIISPQHVELHSLISTPLTQTSTTSTTSTSSSSFNNNNTNNNVLYMPPPVNARERINEFRKVRVIGTGSFGYVYLVQHMMDHNYYALKCLLKSDVVKQNQVEHLHSEKSILSTIHHPFIVNLYQSFQDESRIYLLFEYVAGGEVFKHLRDARVFSNDMAKFYAAEIVLAFEYLHRNNIAYRDLKPENLLIDSQGHIKITDFGFAKRVTDRTFTLCGTPEYLAPEIIQGTGHGKAVDWWALGILIFEMLAGFPPFYDDDTHNIYQKILAGRIAFPVHFDPLAKDLVKKLLTTDRSNRLGALRNGAQDVKEHRWFEGIIWTNLYNRTTPGPFIPNIQHEGDSHYFEQYMQDDKYEDPPPGYVDPYRRHFQDF
ncbi:hypothetical protein SAMD00019534_003340 [Acytostelium subglobosum LB1]|uniref:hypothetical protein n=1 Tax=Acytostelium subglobosum LB1 TaxID=1410327 RepID=UPI000644E09A|nr:hypothetical protein SAMD00019534_003340 [Acytostelium subglobosum LB1]GAM17159.1 hypothetical protein SAMD00019534_003340 [Acytostelium subglobosum LB1]|eukprot:XP_012759221.1 hypothetical protein SAMD00019534_003340 [Acytostelium subglobosum LB1]